MVALCRLEVGRASAYSMSRTGQVRMGQEVNLDMAAPVVIYIGLENDPTAVLAQGNFLDSTRRSA